MAGRVFPGMHLLAMERSHVIVVGGRRGPRALVGRWAPLVVALVASVVLTVLLEGYVASYFATPSSQSLRFVLPEAKVRIEFGLQSEPPMAVEQAVGLAWFYFSKDVIANSSVINPLMVITSANASGVIRIDWLHVAFVGGGAIYVNASSGLGIMEGALHFETPGPQVVNLTLYSSPSDSASRTLVEYSANSSQPKDTVFIDTSEALTNWMNVLLTAQITVLIVVPVAVIAAVADLAGLYDRARKGWR